MWEAWRGDITLRPPPVRTEPVEALSFLREEGQPFDKLGENGNNAL